mgnify:CR=1 FL=1
MKAKKIIVLMLALVLVCTIFVACNENGGNNGEQNGQQVMRKPWAKPDPSNYYDVLPESNRVDFSEMNFDGEYIVVIFTNSESLNNLFYDYKLEDFEDNRFNKVEETGAVNLDRLARIRNQIKNSTTYNPNDSQMVNPSTYTRAIRLYLKEPSKDNALKYANELLENDYIYNVEPNTFGGMWFKTTTNDPDASMQWGMEKIKIYDAWDITTGSSNVTVGHIDTGICRTHEDLTSNVAADGYAYKDATNNINENHLIDTVNHGTLTAGVIGAIGNNGKGISGVCWNVNIVSLKSCVGASDEHPLLVIQAIEYAQRHNIKLLNFSGGFYETNEFSNNYKEDLYNAIRSFGGLIVVSAGNERLNIVKENENGQKLYPQSFNLSNVLVVGATDSNDNKSDFSNYGQTTVDLFAPGENIYTTSNNGNYTYQAGTSLAAPFVTGVAALLLSMEPNLTAVQLKTRIMENVDAIPALSNLCVSGGRLNAKKAVEAHGHNIATCTYTNLGFGAGHSVSCNFCNYTDTELHNIATCTYTNLGFRAGHSVSCDFCDYTDTESHNWSPVKVPGTATVKYHVCTKCFAKTEIIEIPNPSALFSADTLALIGAQEAHTSGDFDIEISEHVAVVKRDGKYYLMIACDDKGHRLADLSKILKREEKA